MISVKEDYGSFYSCEEFHEECNQWVGVWTANTSVLVPSQWHRKLEGAEKALEPALSSGSPFERSVLLRGLEWGLLLVLCLSSEADDAKSPGSVCLAVCLAPCRWMLMNHDSCVNSNHGQFQHSVHREIDKATSCHWLFLKSWKQNTSKTQKIRASFVKVWFQYSESLTRTCSIPVECLQVEFVQKSDRVSLT